jgi:hypothetical protein
LRPGGRLAFDSRNPAARAWDAWTPEQSMRRIGGAEVWQERHATPDPLSTGRVAFTTHYRFENGEERRARSELRFRTRDELAHWLTQAGFAQIDWYGDWMRAPVDETSRELIAVAR